MALECLPEEVHVAKDLTEMGIAAAAVGIRVNIHNQCSQVHSRSLQNIVSLQFAWVDATPVNRNATPNTLWYKYNPVDEQFDFVQRNLNGVYLKDSRPNKNPIMYDIP